MALVDLNEGALEEAVAELGAAAPSGGQGRFAGLACDIRDPLPCGRP